MRKLSQTLQLMTGLTLAGLLVPQAAHAYVDPGSGSFVLQMAVASFLGAAFMMKTYWNNLKHWIGRRFIKAQDND